MWCLVTMLFIQAGTRFVQARADKCVEAFKNAATLENFLLMSSLCKMWPISKCTTKSSRDQDTSR
jgi:hypothetical protein